jgi:hypothetical protein
MGLKSSEKPSFWSKKGTVFVGAWSPPVEPGQSTGGNSLPPQHWQRHLQRARPGGDRHDPWWLVMENHGKSKHDGKTWEDYDWLSSFLKRGNDEMSWVFWNGEKNRGRHNQQYVIFGCVWKWAIPQFMGFLIRTLMINQGIWGYPIFRQSGGNCI